MNLPALCQFRLCTLTDEALAAAVTHGLQKMYTAPVKVPLLHIPAKPDEDFDLLVGELIIRFIEKGRGTEAFEEYPPMLILEAPVQKDIPLSRLHQPQKPIDQD